MAEAASCARNCFMLAVAARCSSLLLLVAVSVLISVLMSRCCGGNASCSRKKTPRLASQTRGQTISLASTSVVKTSMAADYGCCLDSAQIVSRGLSGPSIGDNFVADLLTFVEIAHSSAFDCTDVHEHVLAAVVRLNEAETLLAIKPLYSSCRHRTPSFGL